MKNEGNVTMSNTIQKVDFSVARPALGKARWEPVAPQTREMVSNQIKKMRAMKGQASVLDVINYAYYESINALGTPKEGQAFRHWIAVAACYLADREKCPPEELFTTPVVVTPDDKMVAQVDALKAENSRLQMQLTTANEHLTTVQQVLAEASAAADEGKAQQARIGELEQVVKDLEGELERASSATRKSIQDLELKPLQDRLAQTEQVLRDTQADLELEKEAAVLQNKVVEELRQQLAPATVSAPAPTDTEELTGLRQELKETSRQLDEVLRERNQAWTELETQGSQIKDLQQQLHEALQLAQHRKANEDSLAIECRALFAQRGQWEEELSKWKASQAATDTELVRLREALDQTKRDSEPPAPVVGLPECLGPLAELLQFVETTQEHMSERVRRVLSENVREEFSAALAQLGL
jgi:myosin heavy subunit